MHIPRPAVMPHKNVMKTKGSLAQRYSLAVLGEIWRSREPGASQIITIVFRDEMS
jgi:hypothetical protein